ncbi:MAG: MazG family protein [Oscillospiraceae bacterium]|jgi:tetrapyrrole methylase family protein/MazG family protein|nr:MazG family protein [Oscillospiraceae bacterium]
MVDFVCGSNPGLDKLKEIVAILRSPGGCPWDREQDHASLRGALLEESHEVIDAIDRADAAALREELGDVLLQVVFHSRLAEEKGEFTLEDVMRAVCEKLITRHPHVFGDSGAKRLGASVDVEGVQTGGSAQVLKNWEEIKKKEKSFSSGADALRAVPRSFPALLRADKLLSRAARAGFTQDLSGGGDDAGSVLFAAAAKAKSMGEDPELALHGRLERFIGEFGAWEQGRASNQGL